MNNCSYKNDTQASFNNSHSENFEIFKRIIAHDLKAPLFAIRNLATWIFEDSYQLLPAESQRHLDLLLKRVKRMESLLSDIFTFFFKTQTNQDIKTLNWTIFLKSLLETIDIPESFEIIDHTNFSTFKTNSLFLQIVLTNLFTNAIKYHHDLTKGKIIITGKQQTHYLEIIVSDNGPGIAQEYFDDIFKPLRKLESHDKVEGSGLGLSIVKKLIIQCGGTISLESRINEGSHFIINWPLQL